MSEQEYFRRLQTAKRIFEDATKENYYHYVISENVEQSKAIIDGIVKGQLNPHQDRGQELIKSLQESLKQRIDS
jgi:hypothetical protein